MNIQEPDEHVDLDLDEDILHVIDSETEKSFLDTLLDKFHFLQKCRDKSEGERSGGVGTLMLIFMSYVAVFGAGPYAMEKLIATGYPLITILGLLILPWATGLQCALMTAELSSSIKHNGGFIVWVREAFGEYWSFQVASLSMLSTVIDLAIYPVLFCDYLKELFGLSEVESAFIRLAFVLLCSVLSIFGAQCIGGASIALTLLALSPFIVIFFWGAKYIDPSTWIVLPEDVSTVNWGLFISLLAWCAQGFDSLSQVAEDIKNPKRFKFSMISTLVLIIITSLFPILVAIGVDKEYKNYEEGYFAVIGEKLAGEFMKIWVILGACIGTLATFNIFLYTGSILFSVWAGEEFIGMKIFSLKSKWNTPWVSIIVIASMTYTLTFFDFSALIQIDQAFYQLTLLLKYASLIRLRMIKPDMERPYKIGLETKGLIIFVIPPVIVAFAIIILTSISSIFNLVFTLSFITISSVMPFIIDFIKRNKKIQETYKRIENEIYNKLNIRNDTEDTQHLKVEEEVDSISGEESKVTSEENKSEEKKIDD